MTISSSVSAMVRLLRPYQWYKNLLVIVPLVFVGRLSQLPSVSSAVLAFIGLCLVSSAGYVFNDIVDIESDRSNQEKRDRPLASGQVSRSSAAALALLLAVVGGSVLWQVSVGTLVCGLMIFASTILYTLFFKHEAILDVIILSVNFVLRAAAGAFAVRVAISPWLVICAFFLALLLALGKRLSEMHLLGDAAITQRSALQTYTQENLRLMMGISATVLLVSYTLYTFLHGQKALVLTLPFAVYAVLRYLSLASAGAREARHPHRLLFDIRMLIAILLWTAVVLLVLYAVPSDATWMNWLTSGISV